MPRPHRARPRGRAGRLLALGGLLAAWLGGTALAQAPAAGSVDDARAQIQAGRAQASRRLADETAACMDRFLLAACLQAAQARHREAMAGLDQRQGQLDQAARQARAAQRQQRLAAVSAAPGASRPAPAPAAASRPGPTGTPPPAAAAVPAQARRQPAAAADLRQQAAQQKAAEHARRLQDAQAHRDAVLARVQREDAQRPPARPLPLPLPSVQAAPPSAATPVKPGPAGR